MKFIRAFLQIILRAGLLLFALTLFCTFSEQFLSQKMESELSSMEGASVWLWIFASLSFFISILNPVLSSLFTLAALKKEPLAETIRNYLKPVTIETLRATGSCLSWSLFLILPGVVRYLQLSFVNFVVLLDPEYLKGSKDAIQESSKLVNKRFAPVFFLIFLFMVILPLLMTTLDEWTSFQNHPVTATIVAVIESCFSILFILSLLKQWEKSHGTSIQLETN